MRQGDFVLSDIGDFAPYVYLEDEKNYKIYKRSGNGKRVMGYNELKQTFISSISLEQSIKEYRKERILYYSQLGESFGHKFIHFCVIPETFADLNYRKNMYALARTKKIQFHSIFSGLGMDSSMIPCVDGIRFVPYSPDRLNAECYVKNNGIVEAGISLDGHLNHDLKKYPNGFLPWMWLWNHIESIIYNYGQVYKAFNIVERTYVCLSIIGCRNVQTEEQNYSLDNTGRIDRNEVICDPVEIVNLNDDMENEKALKKLYISYALAIGVKNDKSLNKLIDEVYGDYGG